jgi:diadenosine tetraphosphate (Ap4A) HIT family hydrolase
MKFSELIDYIENRMGTHNGCQPAMIKSLIDSGGSAPLRRLARQALLIDERWLVQYEDHIKAVQLPVLKKHGVVKQDKGGISLATKPLSSAEKTELRKRCDQKIQRCADGPGIDSKGYDSRGSDPALASSDGCRFCYDKIADRIIQELGSVAAIADGYPVTEGHLLIVPKRHIEDYLQMSQRERDDADDLIRLLADAIRQRDPKVTGFNIGANCGESAGQTIFHAHIHLIPRRDGDTPVPKGGVRGVIPGKRSY